MATHARAARRSKQGGRGKQGSPTKDPEGGLTAAGRKHFKETEGANLKPGVKSVKTAEDAKRKGSFLRRHYGKKTPSPLKDADGNPTRYALQAHAWGEPVPKTAADVKKLAEKGARLLERYHKSTEAAPKGRAKARGVSGGGSAAKSGSRSGSRKSVGSRSSRPGGGSRPRAAAGSRAKAK